MSDKRLLEIMTGMPDLMKDLEAVRSLGLPQWTIAAGYVRNRVWDTLHGYAEQTALNDVDVLFYDLSDLEESTEKSFEQRLRELVPEYRWSVKNQARMHSRNGEAPYASVEEAMRGWPETATAVGISLTDDGRENRIVSPYGLEDLFGLAVRQSPGFRDRNAFLRRVREKKWLEVWPKLRLLE
ncbi:nucleotidyltransferase family protein [Cohnella suwonensis]|uniref:Nucleotidyltransferase family protein n=1 Tax=Cohnella suwonensis TaxID=696072 RepID=A0ABW0M2H7_9BACL